MTNGGDGQSRPYDERSTFSVTENVTARRGGNRPGRYRIVVRGELRASYAGPMEGLSVRPEGGFSVITGKIIDQSRLLGVLNWLGGRGIEIVSLRPADDPEEAGDMDG